MLSPIGLLVGLVLLVWTNRPSWCTVRNASPARPGRPARQEETHGTHAARQGVGGAQRPDAAVRPDPAPDRPAPHPRGDHAAGLPDAQGAQAHGPPAGADL